VHDRFWADELVYTGSAGRRRGKADVLRDVRSAPAPKPGDPTTAYTAEDIRIQQYGDTAIVAFRLVGNTTGGPEAGVANYLNTGTFLKRAGRWQAVAWQATRMAPPEGATRPEAAEEEFRAYNRELIGALRAHDRPALERMVADGFRFIHSTGNTEERASYLDRAAAGQLTAQESEIEVQDEQLRVYDGRTAVLVRRGVMRNPSDGSERPLRSVGTFVKMDGRWQWVIGQSSPLPVRPAAAAVDPRVMAGHVGEYQIGEGRTFTVVKEGDVLRALTTGRQPGELIPRSETEFVWFNPEMTIDAQVVFVKDESGKTTHAAFRTNGREVWRAPKVK
jgi:ketosteroid isomerase-like protein